mmetsp:Transcript_7268/g.16457  ORF Transcript_7268/g.16457 Transcript_7268/m.16457 type:complete len:207 (+) Transcript_7268:411-1031(+)
MVLEDWLMPYGSCSRCIAFTRATVATAATTPGVGVYLAVSGLTALENSAAPTGPTSRRLSVASASRPCRNVDGLATVSEMELGRRSKVQRSSTRSFLFSACDAPSSGSSSSGFTKCGTPSIGLFRSSWACFGVCSSMTSSSSGFTNFVGILSILSFASIILSASCATSATGGEAFVVVSAVSSFGVCATSSSFDSFPASAPRTGGA